MDTEPSRHRHAVVALEGMSGLGKTSVVVALARKFGESCLALSELNLGGPNSPPALEGRDHWRPFEAMWRVRLETLTRWRPHKPLVLLDRSYFSTLAVCYALDQTGLPGDYKTAAAAWDRANAACDLLVVIDGPPALGLSRRQSSHEVLHPWNDLTFLDAMRAFYTFELSKFYDGTIKRLDGGKTAHVELTAAVEAEVLRAASVGRTPARISGSMPSSSLRSAGRRFGLGAPYGPALDWT